MPDLVTCKFDKDPIKNERASVETIRILHGREVQIEIDKHMCYHGVGGKGASYQCTNC